MLAFISYGSGGNNGSERSNMLQTYALKAILPSMSTAVCSPTLQRPLIEGLAFFTLLFGDQYSKYLIQQSMVLGQVLPVSSFFNLRYVVNKGVAFGFFDQGALWQRYVLLGIAFFVLLALVFELKNRRSIMMRLALYLIMAPNL